MADPEKVEGEGDKKVDAPVVAEADAFGIPNQEPEPPKEENKEETHELEKNPLVTELRKQLEEVKSTLGGNLSEQRKIIERLEGEIKQAKGGEGIKTGEEEEANANVPFPEIKWSKDLTSDEKDEMTEKELEQMDIIAKMQENQNQIIIDAEKSKTAKQAEKVEDLNSLVRNTAMEIAGQNVELANQIIESSKQFNLVGLNNKQVIDAIANAHKLLPSYKAPKEQGSVKGDPVKNTGQSEDPFGIDKIIEESGQSNDGNYNL